MTTAPLPSELVALIHHTELNKAGWWNKSIQQLILSVIWISGENLTEHGVIESIQKFFGVEIEHGRVSSQFEQLCSSGSLIRLPNSGYKISESARSKLEGELQQTEDVAARAKSSFVRVFQKLCPALDADEQWKLFHSKLLVPLVREIGARTYQLIAGTELVLEATARFPEFLAAYPAEQRPSLRNAVVSFLDPADDSVRSYVLRHLNAYFCLEAGNLRQETIDSLLDSLQHPPTFKIFVDTNFLLSFLELHENPSNEAAKSLVSLTRQLQGKALCKFYVSPETLDEFKRVVAAQQDFLQGLMLPANLANVALEFDLSGIARRFVEFSRNAGQPISADSYFRPYLTDLIPTLRGKNVDFYNEAMGSYSMRQDIIDDILHQLEYEKRRFGNRAKTYEQLRHDVILWHFAGEKRPARVESPVDATFWIVTVDYHFLGYDSYKRAKQQTPIPICLHPTSLIQLLQFWLPRTRQFEDAILDSLRLPLLFQEFDSSAERVTVKILETLARFEKVDQLSGEVVSSILVNEALRHQIAAEPDVQRQIDLVHGALVEENKRALEHLAATSKEKDRLELTVANKEREIEELRAKLVLHQSEVSPGDQMPSEMQARDWSGQRAAGSMQAARGIERRHQVAYFAVAWVSLLVLGLVSSGFIVFARQPKMGILRVDYVIWSLILIVWVLMVDRMGERNAVVRSWWLFLKLKQFRNWIFGLLGLVIGWQIVEQVGGIVVDWARGLLP
jgi:hypothetical protein